MPRTMLYSPQTIPLYLFLSSQICNFQNCFYTYLVPSIARRNSYRQQKTKPPPTNEMCITTTKYGCGHEKSEEKECRWYRHEVISAQNERKKRGFLVNLFRRSSKVVCPLPPGIVELMHQVCPGCTENRKQRNTRLREHREVMSEDDDWRCVGSFVAGLE